MLQKEQLQLVWNHFNDVISSTAISYGSSYLANYGLTTDMICASILSLGNLTKDGNGTYIKRIVDLGLLGCGGTKNEEQLYDSIKNYDMNTYVQGGLALDGFYPTRLHGSYKYVSNSTSDAGEVILLGTKYNTTTKKRMLVGAGYKNDLNKATDNYEDFDVYYNQLTDEDPDTLVVICMSSGITNCADASKLYLDNLYLLSDCYDVENLATSEITTNSAIISWNENRRSYYEYAYGIKGFDIDNAELSTTTAATIELSNLTANTNYELYVRTVCSATNSSDWQKIEFTTEKEPEIVTPTCALVANLATSNITTTEATILWDEADYTFEYIYGEKDFTLDETATTTTTDHTITLTNLDYNTSYDVYVRATKDGYNNSDWSKISFTTADLPTCENVSNIAISNITTSEATVSWNESENSYELYYGKKGITIEEATIIPISTNSYDFSNLDYNTDYEVYIRAVADNAYKSDWVQFEFSTPDLPTCDTISGISVSNITLSEATISWNEFDYVYELAYGELGFTLDDATIHSIATNSYNLTDLQSNTSYEVYVRATKENYYTSDWTKTTFTTDKETCETVTNAEITNITDSSAVLQCPTANEYTYEFVYAIASQEPDFENPTIISGNSATIENLNANVEYNVYVRATKDNMYASDWTKYSFTTDDIEIPTPENPDTVSNISITDITTSSATITWTNSEYNYELVYGKNGFVIDNDNIIQLTSNSYEIANLDYNTSYDVYVRTEKDGLYSEWTKVSFSTIDLPTCDAVLDVQATNITTEQATISWADADYTFEYIFGETGFAIEDENILSTSTNSTLLQNLVANTEYEVYVRATKENYYTRDWTKTTFTTDKETCETVTNAEITNITDSSAILQCPTTNEYTYEFVYAIASQEPDFENPTIISGNSATIENLNANIEYNVYVRATKDNMYASDWTKYSFTTDDIEIPTPENPDTVSNILITDITTSSATITWTNSEYNYELVYGENGFVIDNDNIIQLTSNSYEIANLDYNTSYDVYVRAEKDGLYSEWTKVSFSTIDLPTCDAVLDIQATNITTEQATISWTDDDYTFEYIFGETGFAIEDENILSTSTNSILLQNLVANTEYEVYVRATKENYYTSDWTKTTFTTEDIEIIEPEILQAPSIENIIIVADTNKMQVTWDVLPDFTFEVAICKEGEPIDNATIQKTTENLLDIVNLEEGETYDIYIRAIADNYEPSEWTKETFTFRLEQIDCRFCSPVQNIVIEEITETTATISWTNPEDNSENSWFEISLTNTIDTIKTTEPRYTFENLNPNTTYNASIRVGADDFEPSSWESIEFKTNEATAIKTISANDISVFPTVSNGDITITYDTNDEAQVTIYDMSGASITKLNTFVSGSTIQITTSGVYKVVVRIGTIQASKTIIIK